MYFITRDLHKSQPIDSLASRMGGMRLLVLDRSRFHVSVLFTETCDAQARGRQ